ncbi:MAG: agmatine deiminase family protein [Candidatus Caenarcaniphilales bacterium]|nr:agmatine deiminase family protein [Candidatus Caenarcaniphilales bacterium]
MSRSRNSHNSVGFKLEFQVQKLLIVRRLPAEWEKQSGVQLTWPHKDSDWSNIFDSVEKNFIEIAKEITEVEKLLIVVKDKNVDNLKALLNKSKANLKNITFANANANDVWARDHAAISVYENGNPLLLKFNFNGWGEKYEHNFDNDIHKQLLKNKIFQAHKTEFIDLVLEGGSIESDGNGTILTTTSCLLNKNRNPNLTKVEIENKLKKYLGIERILWIDNGLIEGDDTDGHIDTLARFCSNEKIAYVGPDNQKAQNFPSLKDMEKELSELKTIKGNSYNLVKLPSPSSKYDQDGNKLPATYANFLILNTVVLVPTYDDPSDNEALEIIQDCFKERKVIGIDCQSLIIQRGSLHCVTMHYPRGVIF